MTPAAPAIYARNLTPARLGPLGRIISLAVAAASLAVLIVAATLDPDPSGIGSHQNLGLDPCQFERNTGLPCISCGMTTSFSHFVRGQVLASFYVQPLGMLLAFATALLFWAGLYIAATARPVHRMLQFFPLRLYLIPLFTMMILAWIWKIWIHLTGRDGWT